MCTHRLKYPTMVGIIMLGGGMTTRLTVWQTHDFRIGLREQYAPLQI
jgi:hypothetical protein